jgi:hypothetical protein
MVQENTWSNQISTHPLICKPDMSGDSLGNFAPAEQQECQCVGRVRLLQVNSLPRPAWAWALRKKDCFVEEWQSEKQDKGPCWCGALGISHCLWEWVWRVCGDHRVCRWNATRPGLCSPFPRLSPHFTSPESPYTRWHPGRAQNAPHMPTFNTATLSSPLLGYEGRQAVYWPSNIHSYFLPCPLHLMCSE